MTRTRQRIRRRPMRMPRFLRALEEAAERAEADDRAEAEERVEDGDVFLCVPLDLRRAEAAREDRLAGEFLML